MAHHNGGAVNTKHYEDKDIDSITIDVFRKQGERWGIEILSQSGLPSSIKTVKARGPCDLAGVQEGDYLLAVNGISVLNYDHDEICEIIGEADRILKLKVLPPENVGDHGPSSSKP